MRVRTPLELPYRSHAPVRLSLIWQRTGQALHLIFVTTVEAAVVAETIRRSCPLLQQERHHTHLAVTVFSSRNSRIEPSRLFALPRKDVFFDPSGKNENGCGTPALSPTFPTWVSCVNLRARNVPVLGRPENHAARS
jgi:hypothetical protein